MSKFSTKKIIFSFIIGFVFLATLVFTFLLLNNEEKTNFSIKIFDANKTIKEKTSKMVEEGVLEIKEPKSITAAIPIFMYHFVSEDPGENPYPENVIKPSELEKQLKYLSSNGYETIFVTDLEFLQSYKKPIMLTFDDGFLDFYTNAFPLFKKYNMKASLYVVKDFTIKGGYCNLEQIKEMEDSGLIDIQSHTVTHTRLATLSLEQIKTELVDSKTYLKEKLGKDSTVICYPYGSYDKRVLEQAKESYKYGLAMDGGVYYTSKHKNLLEIPRIYANRSMPLSTYINYASKSKVDVVW